jgi:hypothetical protein
MSVRIGALALFVLLASAASPAQVNQSQADHPAEPATPKLPPPQWQLKQGAPPAAAELLDRAKRQREIDFAAQLRAVERARKDVEARKAGRVVRELKSSEGWRAVRPRAGDVAEYTFKNPQIKGREVVKAETMLQNATRRLSDISDPQYLPKPSLRVEELKEGSVGTVSMTVIQQVSGTEAVARVDDIPPAWVNGKLVESKGSKVIYVSDAPAQDYLPGMSLRDWTIEVIGTTTYQGENGRARNALHAKPLDWRKWVELARRTDRP